MKEHLAHFDIAGFTYYDGAEAFRKLKIGTKLNLVLDEENKYDSRAIAIYFDKLKLGYIPRSENRIFYKLLKVGITNFETSIQRIDASENPEHQIGVIVHLVKG